MRIAQKMIAAMLVLASGPVFAGEYTESNVTIVQVKANYDGICFLRYKYASGTEKPGASWTCNSAYGVNMLNLAEAAYLTRTPVDLILEGNGADFKPLHAISQN